MEFQSKKKMNEVIAEKRQEDINKAESDAINIANEESKKAKARADDKESTLLATQEARFLREKEQAEQDFAAAKAQAENTANSAKVASEEQRVSKENGIAAETNAEKAKARDAFAASIKSIDEEMDETITSAKTVKDEANAAAMTKLHSDKQSYETERSAAYNQATTAEASAKAAAVAAKGTALQKAAEDMAAAGDGAFRSDAEGGGVDARASLQRDPMQGTTETAAATDGGDEDAGDEPQNS